MNVNDILNKAVKLLGITDLTVSSESADPRLAKLTNALGVTYMQLITEYAPLEKEEEITVTDGEYALGSLSAAFYDAVRLRDANGDPVKCRIRGGKVYAENGTYKLLYYYLPSAYPAVGGTVTMPERITEDLLARGVAAEYALESMLYEEALLHDRKYKEGLHSVLSVHKSVHLDVSRWI